MSDKTLLKINIKGSKDSLDKLETIKDQLISEGWRVKHTYKSTKEMDGVEIAFGVEYIMVREF